MDVSEPSGTPPEVVDNSSKKLDDILAYYLNDCIIEDGNIIGYFEERETFDVIILKMKDRGYTFSVRDSDIRKKKVNATTTTGEHFGNEEDEASDPGLNTVFYHLKAMSISFFGLPFTVEKTTHYQCTYGCKYYKSKAGRKRKEEDSGHALPVKKRRSVMSKKMGCLAKMTLKKITVYPDYGLDAIKDWRKKKRLIENLRKALGASANEVRKSCRYYLCVSLQSRHNHPPIVSDVPAPKTKRFSSESSRSSAKLRKRETTNEEGSWVTLYPANKEEVVVDDAKALTVQDANFFNSLVKFPANTITYGDMKPMTIGLDMNTFEVDRVPGQEEPRMYQFEAIQCPSAQDLQTLFKEKLKRLYTLSEHCVNTGLLMRLIAEFEQADSALVTDIGFDPS